jgi:hypothetical protein
MQAIPPYVAIGCMTALSGNTPLLESPPCSVTLVRKRDRELRLEG